MTISSHDPTEGAFRELCVHVTKPMKSDATTTIIGLYANITLHGPQKPANKENTDNEEDAR